MHYIANAFFVFNIGSIIKQRERERRVMYTSQIIKIKYKFIDKFTCNTRKWQNKGISVQSNGFSRRYSANSLLKLA